MNDREELISNRDYTMKTLEEVNQDLNKPGIDDMSKNLIRTLFDLQKKFKNESKLSKQDKEWIWFYVNSKGVVYVFKEYELYHHFMERLKGHEEGNPVDLITKKNSKGNSVIIDDVMIIKYLQNKEFVSTLKSYGVELNHDLTIKDTVKFQQKTVPQKTGQKSTIVNSDQLRKLNPSEIADFIIEATPVSSILACIIDGLKDSKNKNIDVSGISRTALDYLERAGDLQEEDQDEDEEEEEEEEGEEVKMEPLSMLDMEDLSKLRQLISQMNNATSNKEKRGINAEINKILGKEKYEKYDLGTEHLVNLGYKGFGRTSPQSYRRSMGRNFGMYGLQNGPAWSGVYPMSLKVTGDFPNLDLLNNRGFMAFGSNKRRSGMRSGMRSRKARSNKRSNNRLSKKRSNKRSNKLSKKYNMLSSKRRFNQRSSRRSNKRSNKLSNRRSNKRSNKLSNKRSRNNKVKGFRSNKLIFGPRKRSGGAKLRKTSMRRSGKLRSRRTSQSKHRTRFGSFVAPLPRTIL